MRIVAGVVCLGLVGCSGRPPSTFDGEDTFDWFPLDGEREWSFTSTDSAVPYRLAAYKAEEGVNTEDGLTRIYTVTFSYRCFGFVTPPCDVDIDGTEGPDVDGQPAFSWEISADSAAGVQFWAFTEGETRTEFDPPVKLADPVMREGEEVAGTANAVDYTSSFVGRVSCDVPYWRDRQPDDCFQFDLAADGLPLPTSLRSIYQFNIVAFTFPGEEATWELQTYADL